MIMGSLMELVAYSKIDSYLTRESPHMNFFKVTQKKSILIQMKTSYDSMINNITYIINYNGSITNRITMFNR